jgi:hypothetical protein
LTFGSFVSRQKNLQGFSSVTFFKKSNQKIVRYELGWWTGLAEKASRNFFRRPFKKKRVREKLFAEVVKSVAAGRNSAAFDLLFSFRLKKKILAFSAQP